MRQLRILGRQRNHSWKCVFACVRVYVPYSSSNCKGVMREGKKPYQEDSCLCATWNKGGGLLFYTCHLSAKVGLGGTSRFVNCMWELCKTHGSWVGCTQQCQEWGDKEIFMRKGSDGLSTLSWEATFISEQWLEQRLEQRHTRKHQRRRWMKCSWI